MADHGSARAKEFEAIKRRDQANLVDFLVNDTELAFIFLETAQISDSPVHVQGLIKEAQKALASVRHFLERVEIRFNGTKFTKERIFWNKPLSRFQSDVWLTDYFLHVLGILILFSRVVTVAALRFIGIVENGGNHLDQLLHEEWLLDEGPSVVQNQQITT
jgi:hypothetical protein